MWYFCTFRDKCFECAAAHHFAMNNIMCAFAAAAGTAAAIVMFVKTILCTAYHAKYYIWNLFGQSLTIAVRIWIQIPKISILLFHLTTSFDAICMCFQYYFNGKWEIFKKNNRNAGTVRMDFIPFFNGQNANPIKMRNLLPLTLCHQFEHHAV